MDGLIKHQKEVATKLLHTLEGADPYAILAGGAPRDWYFNKPANDLDFYVHVGNKPMQSSQELQFKRLGLEVKRMSFGGPTAVEYMCMEHLHSIYEGSFEGVKYQIMVMNASTFDCVVSNFGASVCMAWWKGYDVNVTEEFLLSHYIKTIFIKDNYTAKELHVNKMKERYPDYMVHSFSDYQQFRQELCIKHSLKNWYSVSQQLKELLDGKS